MFGRTRIGFPPFAERFFERGDLKYVVLDLLKDQARHGYDVIRQLEERFGGFYAPSPGAVYPTLQLLEDLGYVTAVQQEGRKVYTITDEGRGFLTERTDTVNEISSRVGRWWGREGKHELRDIMEEARDLGRVFRRAGGRWQDPEKLSRIRAVIAQARREIEQILLEESSQGSSRHSQERPRRPGTATGPSDVDADTGTRFL